MTVVGIGAVAFEVRHQAVEGLGVLVRSKGNGGEEAGAFLWIGEERDQRSNIDEAEVT